ncbi:hypothetical protein V8D89_007458 [Ganoderma adspersum]
MWLLSTDRAQLHYFASPENIPGGYAILSHVWGQEEQSFQDLLALQKDGEAGGSNPRDKASEKIRRCCEVSESHGFRWIWNDTCCIDKTSSAELSEAIGSMYRYYSLAKVCFAYLADVSGDNGRIPGKEFRWSRWHERGWTLQELLAPRLVVFMSRDWFLFASSPDNFGLLFGRNIRFEPYKLDEPPLLDMDGEQWLDLVAHVPTFSITPYGVLAHIFVINWRGLIVALLVDPQHQLFDISIELEGGRFRRRTVFRVITFNDSEDSLVVTPVASAGWRDVYLSHQAPSSGSSIESLSSKAWRTVPFSALSLETPF